MEKKMFSYFKLAWQKVAIIRSAQLNIVREMEKSFEELILMTAKGQQASKEFRLQAKTVLEQVKFSIEKYEFDDDIIDAVLEIGDYIIYYISGYTKRKPSAILENMLNSQPQGIETWWPYSPLKSAYS